MRIFIISFCFLLCATNTVLAQQSEFGEEVKTYLMHNGTSGQYEYAYDGLLKMLENQYPPNEENKKGWTYLNENKAKSVNEMLLLLSPIYAKHFSRDEIKGMTNFYQSEAGKQLVLDRSQMTAVHKEELNTYYNSALGKKVMEKQMTLSKEISAVSEAWSRDLYETAVSLLK